MENRLAMQLTETELKSEYDQCAKRLIAQKVILAWILKSCAHEFQNFSIEYIMENCIEADPQIGMVPVDPDQTAYIDGDEMIVGQNTEDRSIHEGVVRYDIRFTAIVPEAHQRIGIIINIEIQNDANPGYPLVKRGHYYCSRLTSAQLGTVFQAPHYEKLRKVYSFWICPHPKKGNECSIEEYGIQRKIVYGSNTVEASVRDYDLETILLLNLGEKALQDQGSILNLLQVLLTNKLLAVQKKEILHDDFHIAMNRKLESEVSLMCNLSKGVWESGVQQGVQQGIQQGIQQGKHENAVEIVKRMLSMNQFTLETIAEISRLPLEEVQKLAVECK